MNKMYIKPDHTTAYRIKEARRKTGLTQKEFADLINVSVPTVERWESSDKEIHGPVALLADILIRNPDLLEERIVPEKEYPIRMWYMYKDQVCTLIDADPARQRIRIKNYQDHLMFRAFGPVEQPSYRQYEAFLESRCFPRSRDKMKLILKELQLPFYDPLMIVEKTEGRMAEDDFWIRVENNDPIR